MFGSFKITLYLCIVFFIVLDLRLTKVMGSAEPFFYVYTLSEYYNKNSPTASQWQRNTIVKIKSTPFEGHNPSQNKTHAHLTMGIINL